MYYELYEYLVLHKQLNLPGIGTFVVHRKPSVTQFTHKQIDPPAYSISLEQANSAPAKKLFNWLANRFDITYHEAIIRVNEFAYELRNQVLAGNKVFWKEVGTLSKGLSGEIKFEPALQEYSFDRPVSAVRVIRENAVHTVRVGEQEKTSEEMTEWLNPLEEKKTKWWVPALVAGILVIVILIIYLSQKGWSASGYQQSINTQEPATSYQVIKSEQFSLLILDLLCAIITTCMRYLLVYE